MGRVISTALQLIDGFTKPSKQAIESMKRMGKEFMNTGKQIQSAGKAITSAGTSLTAGITMPIAGVATAAVKTAADFEAAMSEVGAISGASAQDLTVLTNKAKEMGAATAFSAKESAEAMKYMAMAGWKTVDMTEGIAGIMDLAAASGEELGAVSDIVTDALTAFGMSAKESSRFADVLATTSSSANTNVSMMGESFKYCASTAGAMGYSIEDISVALGVMANAGVKGSAAGTTLKNVIANLAKPTADQAKMMQSLGISLTDSSGNMKSFAEVMDNLRFSFAGLSETEKAAAATILAGKQGMSGLLTIVNAGEEDFKNLTAAINGASGSAGEMAGKMLDNLNGQLTLLKSATEGIAITIGNKLMPYIKTGVSWVQKAADYINNLSSAQVDNIIKWAGMAAAVGPAVLVFGKIVTTVGNAVSTFGKITKTIANFGGVMGLITSPAGIVIGVVAGIAAAAFLIIKNWDQVKGFLSGLGEWVKNTFEKAGVSVKGFRENFSSIGTSVSNIARTISGAVKNVAGIFKNEFGAEVLEGCQAAGNGIQTAAVLAVGTFSVLIDTADKGIKAFSALVDFFGGAFRGNWDTAAQGFRESLKGIFPTDMADGMIAVFDKALPVVTAAVEGVKTAFGGLLQDTHAILGGVKTVFGGLGTFLKGILSRDAKTAWKGFQTIAEGTVDIIGNVIRAKFNAMKNFVIGTVSTFLPQETVNKIAGAFDVAGAAWNTAIGAVSTATQSMTAVVSGLIKVFDGITTFVGGVFTSNWSQAWTGVRTIFSGIFDSLAALCKAPLNAVIGIINEAVSGINKLGLTIPDWVPGMGGKTFSINIPTIPMLYKGTGNWSGGPAVIHDRGGEIVDLPRGTRVYPHDKSVEMARREGARQGGGGSITITIQKLADRIEVRSDKDIDRIAEALALKLKKIAFNTA